MKPILGLKNSCAPDSIEMYKAFDQYGEVIGIFIADGQNVEFSREHTAINKAFGYATWSHTAIGTPSLCMGLHEIFDGTNRDYIFFDHGKVYYYDGTKDPVEITVATPVTFATDPGDMYSIIDFGSYVIWADYAEHTPYKWKHGDANSTKLILSGTEYQFRYLTHVANRIIGAYTTEATSPDLSVRWTDALPTWASLSFPAANQAYKPVGDDSITGLASMGNDFGYIFSEKDITRIEYYPSHSPVFSFVCAMRDIGTISNQSILSDGKYLYFFDIHRGFIQYNGATDYKVISEPIEGVISGISVAYAPLIVGKSIPSPTGNKLIWSIPSGGNATPNKIISYDPTNEIWTPLGTEVARAMDYWRLPSATESSLVFANTNGVLYQKTGETADGAAWDGYFITPIIPTRETYQKKRLLEIWLSINNRYAASTYIHIYHRGGDTAGELENQDWVELGTIDMKDSAKPVLYCDKTERLHQLKIRTNAATEYFSIGDIKVGYIVQGRD